MQKHIQEILAELRVGLERLYGARLEKVVLFGSHARGDAEAGSDIDVLVLLRPPVESWTEIRRTGPLVAELSLRRNVVIACVFDTSATLAAATDAFHQSVRREGIPL